ncbi:MAG: Uncharacterized protein JWN52_5090 [Actinomycetia bacterium]|nr:Uncharacterized protein [Actinomycetes bacterium]
MQRGLSRAWMAAMRYRARASRLLVAFVAVAAMVAAAAAPVAAAPSAGGNKAGTVGVRLASAGSPTRSAPSSTPCFQSSLVCQSTNPDVTLGLVSLGDTSACTFHGTFAWGDGSQTTFTFSGASNGSTLIIKKHHYGAARVYNGTWAALLATGSTCHSSSGSFQFTLECTPIGASWVTKFPDSHDISKLSPAFKGHVTRFIHAMTRAGIAEHTVTTLRPLERAYLMHYSWLIAKGKLAAAKVPDFVPAKGKPYVTICWTKAAAGKTVAQAAKALVAAYGIDPKLKVAPALKSRHTAGNAIDMSTTWSKRSITIVDGNGHQVKISSSPHSGLNSRLIAVGATYGVVHYLTAAKDANHWSTDGH